MAHAGGRPLKFQDVEELQTKIDAYFADCDPHTVEVTEWVEARKKDGTLKKDKYGLNYLVEATHKIKTEQKPYTITGLALALDTSRETLLDYEENAQFSDTLKAAKDKCQSYAEKTLYTAPNVTGAIFNLKNNYGWRDQQDIDHTTKGEKLPAPILGGASNRENESDGS